MRRTYEQIQDSAGASAAALDVLRASRPLRPPAGRPEPRSASGGELERRNDVARLEPWEHGAREHSEDWSWTGEGFAAGSEAA